MTKKKTASVEAKTETVKATVSATVPTTVPATVPATVRKASSKASTPQVNAFGQFIERYRDDPVGFCENVLGVKLLAWQKEALTKIGRDKTRRLSICAGHGVGKALTLRQVVPTPQGDRLWGDIQVGDELFGRDGKPTKVTFRTEDRLLQMYRVTFDDGSSTVACEDHLWTVRGRQQRRKGLDEWITMSTKEILAKGVLRANGVAQAKQWELPKHEPVQYPPQAVPVDPYLLGVWLGDGCSGSGVVATSEDVEIPEQIKARGSTITLHKTDSNCVKFNVAGLKSTLREIGILNCVANSKFIPELYKHNTPEVRMDVLRGLLDTDGTVGKGNGTITYTTVSKQLADDVVWLARSLGGKANIQDAVKKAFYKNEAGERVDCQDAYNVTLRLPNGVRCFYVERKQARINPNAEDRYLARWIASIEYVGEEWGMCVTVDAPDHLYLCNDFIVTHNTAMVSMAAIHFLVTRYPAKIIITAPSAKTLESGLMPEVKVWMKKLPPVIQDLFEVKSEIIQLKADPNASFLQARTSSADRPEALAGIHSENVLIIVDEASGVPENVFEAAAGSMSGASATTVLISNPTRLSGLFFRSQHELKRHAGNPDGVWDTMQVSCLDVPEIVSEDFINEMKISEGEESNQYRIRVEGKFARTDDDALIAAYLVEEAMIREIDADPQAPIVYGLDPARFGSDRQVLCKRQGNTVLGFKVWRNLDLMQLCGHVINEAKQDNPIEIMVDSIGIGAGVADRLRELGLPVRDVNVSEQSAMNPSANRLRDELWIEVRDWLRKKACKLPDDRVLREELCAPTYTFGSTGKMIVESKDGMKKRLRRSPDLADALCLTFASAACGVGGRSMPWVTGKALKRNIRGVV